MCSASGFLSSLFIPNRTDKLQSMMPEPNTLLNEPNPEILWCMENFDLFKHLSMLEMERLRQRVKTLTYKRGEIIYLPGDPGDTVYFLKRGQVKLDYLDASGRRLTLKICHRGEPFGEAALVGEDSRKLIAEAHDNVELCAIAKDDLLQFAEGNTGLSLRISKLIGLRLVELENRLEDLFFKDVPTRLSRLLLKLGNDFGMETDQGIEIKMKITHQDMADLIGSRRETTSVVLGEFEDEGLIEKGHGHIWLKDLAGLKAKAQLLD